MAKIRTRSIKVPMWDNTSTAPKDKDGNPIKHKLYDVRFNAACCFDRKKK